VVAQFLRLKVTLLANTFRRSPIQLVGMLLGLLYGLGLATMLAFAFVGLRFATPDIARVVIIVFGSIVVLGFLVLPLVFGVDDTIDPRRFSLFGISTTRLAINLAIAAAVSVPTLVITVLSFAQVATWARGTAPVLFALASVILIVPTCVLASRVTTGIAATFLASRRARDATGILFVLGLAIAAPAIALLAAVDWQAQGIPIMRRIAAVVSWTPLGAAWSAPGDAAIGNVDVAWTKLAIALGFLIVLALVWRALVGAMLVKPHREAVAREYSGLGWFEWLPATPLGAIAARSLSYWGRDARYRVSVAVIPVVPIVMVAALLVGGVPTDLIVWLPLPVMCLFLGWTVHNDIAYDSSAFWAHVSADTRGTDDRWGRLVPPLLIGIPLIAVGSVASALVAGDFGILPGLVGLSACVLLVALGISSVISAGFPYPAVRPGDSPFAQPQAAGAAGSVVQSLSFFLTILVASPVALLMILLPATPGIGLYALATGLTIGLLFLLGGVLVGGRIVNRRAPELLAFTLQN